MNKEEAVEFSFPETQRMDGAEMKKREQEMRENILRHYFGITKKPQRNRMKRYDGR